MRRKNIGEIIFKNLSLICSLLIIITVGAIFYELIIASIPSINKFGWKFLIETIWDPVAEHFGALPSIYGTLITSLIALILGFPISVGIAIFLAEICPYYLKRPLSFIIELLGAIPSIIYGMWGLFTLAPILQLKVGPFLNKYLGFTPLFQGYPMGVGFLTAGIVLAIMIIPTISSISREILLAVPREQREGALALGMTQWEMIWKIVLGNAKSGILAAGILGLGRALGETMAVTMVIGNSPQISLSLFSPGYTISSTIANEFTEAVGKLHLSTLIELALILFFITFFTIAFTRYFIIKRIERR
ncbi:MAG: phosphate ABC transporter permease subunit PstC [Dictyoglomus sp.]|nr:phosphate ABC transporter permease subunit PstC [Dictyoglomus sp.]MCX7845910.1 phosphate ABC transporter permease subunit PstC [Dictyoglomaceae bacterium]MDW8187881.1 phosphate ABC transporter permease subunit PstC [Dictyoglomus sp.]